MGERGEPDGADNKRDRITPDTSFLVTLSNTVRNREPIRHREASISFRAAPNSGHQALIPQIPPLGAIRRRPIVASLLGVGECTQEP